MKYADIDQYFKSEEGLIELIGECQDTFNLIDDYSEAFLNNKFTTPIEYQEALTKITGAKMFLDPIHKFAETVKRNEELQKYMDIKNTQKKGEKFIDGAAKEEATAFVHSYRKVRNVVEGYINACMSGIRTCEDKLAEFKWDYNRTKNG